MAQVGLTLSTRVSDDFSCLEGLMERIDQALRDGTQDSADILYAAAFANINKRTGRTASTIGEDVAGMQAWVGSSDKIAIILEDGSRAHVIRGGGMLRFVSGGGVIYRKQVNHPGTQPYRWLERAFYGSLGAMEAAYVSRLEAAFAACG